jgi:hypothetical protein
MTNTDMPQQPPGWVFKVEDHEGDPFARYLVIRQPDADEAKARISKTVTEKMVRLERNAIVGEVAGLRPNEIRSLSTGPV